MIKRLLTLASDNSKSVLVSWLFLRGLALIYFSAFASMSVQIVGLIGSNGILPIRAYLSVYEQLYLTEHFWHLPTIFWFNASDYMLTAVCYAGMLAAALLLLNLYARFSLIVCYLLYLSIVKACQDFTQFQWDIFLLETGFLAIFLTWGSGIIVLLYRWLLARFMFMGGVVKLASGDPTWANLTALNYHYETQPLPSPLAYYAFYLPAWFHEFCVVGVFFIELVVPFFVFLPRKFRVFACISFVLLQSSIILTGNYTFFNLLTLLLCLWLLDDNDILRLIPRQFSEKIRQNSRVAGTTANTIAGFWATLVLLVCGCQIWLYHFNTPLFRPLYSLVRTASHFSLVNNYGPFAVMTTKRYEIIIQGSNDGKSWQDYLFKYKPGRLDKPLSWIIPHMPRLDWQMWFAALYPAPKDSWFDHFIIKLLQGSPQVLSLLEENPFVDKPPKFIRAIQYRYRFTTLQQRQQNGQIWQRQDGRIYWPAHRLQTNKLEKHTDGM